MRLYLLLANTYNAPWPKIFNPEAFTLPDMSSVQSTREIQEMGYDDQLSMAKALLKENKDMIGTTWYGAYLQPIKDLLNVK